MKIKHNYYPAGSVIFPHSDFDALYVDIETTGLSRDRTILYIIGCGFYEDQRLHIIQWFNDDGVSEMQLLIEFHNLLTQKSWTIITFNGDNFDLPYLKRHFELQELSCQLDNYPSIDLYRILRPYQKLFDMEHGRQKDWERFMGIHREDTFTGGELIHIYKEYLTHKDDSRLHLLLRHNREDLWQLSRLSSLLSFKKMQDGQFCFHEVSLDSRIFSSGEASLKFSCTLKTCIPRDFMVDGACGALFVRGSSLELYIPVITGAMKHFFPDYGSYYYLPQEDRAVHKSIGQYVEKAYREKCTARNCYIKKEGVFLPAAENGSVKQLTSYSPDYNSRKVYIDFDELFAKGSHILDGYLREYLNALLFTHTKGRTVTITK